MAKLKASYKLYDEVVYDGTKGIVTGIILDHKMAKDEKTGKRVPVQSVSCFVQPAVEVNMINDAVLVPQDKLQTVAEAQAALAND